MAFSKSLIACAIAVICGSHAAAHAQSISDADRALVERTEASIDEIIDEMELEALEQRGMDNMAAYDGIAPAATPSLEQGSLDEQRAQAQEKSDNFYREHEIVIFASLSLEGEGLDDILEAASANPRIAVVFRGVPEGMKIDEGMQIIQQLAYTYDPMPTIAIDPTMFDEHGIDAVPAMIVMEPAPATNTSLDDFPSIQEVLDNAHDMSDLLADIDGLTAAVEQRQVLAKVMGLTDTAWVQRKLSDGERGDFGIEGPLTAIDEPHLIEAMKEKALALDWEAHKQGAIDRFWTRQSDNMHWKPAATTERTRRIDPSVTVIQDILDGNGEMLTPAGTVINPLDHMPFDIALVIFDGGDNGQIAVAKERGRELEAQEGVRQVMYLMTQFDTLDGWDGYEAISDALDRHVYLLTSDVEKRFEIERVPSIVTADSTHFIVEEVVAPSATHELVDM